MAENEIEEWKKEAQAKAEQAAREHKERLAERMEATKLAKENEVKLARLDTELVECKRRLEDAEEQGREKRARVEQEKAQMKMLQDELDFLKKDRKETEEKLRDAVARRNAVEQTHREAEANHRAEIAKLRMQLDREKSSYEDRLKRIRLDT